MSGPVTSEELATAMRAINKSGDVIVDQSSALLRVFDDMDVGNLIHANTHANILYIP